MSAIVEALEDVVDAVDKYIVQPIAQDPLTFIATVAGAAFLGPAAAGYFGTSATIGAGIGAAAGNTAAGLAQGEDFDEAIKGGALAGVTTWAGGELINKFSSSTSTPPASAEAGIQPIGQGNTTLISDAAKNWGNAADDVIAGSADDVITGASGSGNPANAWSMASKSATSSVDDALTSAANPLDEGFNPIDENIGMAGKGPDVSWQGPGALKNTYNVDGTASVKDMYGQWHPADQVQPIADAGGGVYRSAANAIDDASVSSGGGSSGGVTALDKYGLNMNDPNYYQNLANAEAKAFSNANPVEAINQNIRTSPMVEGGTGNTSYGSWRMAKPEPELSLWDQGMKYGSDALKWAEQHPYYTGAAALGAYSLLNKDKPQDKPDPNAQIGDPGFYRPLDIYNMNRQQLGYGDDIYSYGTRGGEAQFFTPTVYEPVRLASGGSVASDNYGYYTYGNIPRTMRGFAKGGLGSLQKRGVFDGRSDDIPAVLSDGEFVVDAETVALLGNGSSKAGADRLEEMRQSVRKQKGGALSRGEFSPDAKSPLAYLKSSKRGRG